MKFVIFTIFIMVAMAMVAQGCYTSGSPCRSQNDCCEGYYCVPHANVCVLKRGPTNPGIEEGNPPY